MENAFLAVSFQHKNTIISLAFFYSINVIIGLTAEGVVPPADGDSCALTGLSVRLHIVAQSQRHAIVLTHVVDAVTNKGLRGHQSVTGLKSVGEENLAAVGLVELLFLCSAVGMDVWTSVWLAAKKKSF